MSLEISFADNDLKKDINTAHLKKTFALTLEYLKKTPEYKKVKELIGTPKTAELYFCDDVEMRAYQKKFRNLDRTTDVLSFPTLESPDYAQSSFLGSLIVSVPSVQRNAKRYKRTYQRELYEVCVHGVLHLFGFDHVKVSSKKKQRMRKVQKEISTELFKLLKR